MELKYQGRIFCEDNGVQGRVFVYDIARKLRPRQDGG